MGRLMALDLGRKRCGIAVTDSLQLIANALCTVPSMNLDSFLKEYFQKEDVEKLIIGKPTTLHGELSESWQYISQIINRLKKVFPNMPLEFYDERFTSTLAHRAMIEGGMKKTDRQAKENADKIAASILLNDYLESKRINRI